MGLSFDTYGIFMSPANARLNGSIFSSRRRTREKGIIFSKRLSPKNPEARDFDFLGFSDESAGKPLRKTKKKVLNGIIVKIERQEFGNDY